MVDGARRKLDRSATEELLDTPVAELLRSEAWLDVVEQAKQILEDLRRAGYGLAD